MSRPIREGARWNIQAFDDGTASNENIGLSLLQEIANRLWAIQRVLECENTTDIPQILRAIRRNTAKPRRKR